VKFVVDASVAVKWFADEPLFDKARELQQHSLAAPDLIFAEAANVIWKLWRKGVLTDAHYASRGEALKDAARGHSGQRSARICNAASTTVAIWRWRFGRAAR
jgi:predicted nucleic acid-binding protein